MARKKRAKELQPNIKVRLDRRTVITVRDQEKLAFWKEKYPNLEVLEEWAYPLDPNQKKAGHPAFFNAAV